MFFLASARFKSTVSYPVAGIRITPNGHRTQGRLADRDSTEGSPAHSNESDRYETKSDATEREKPKRDASDRDHANGDSTQRNDTGSASPNGDNAVRGKTVRNEWLSCDRSVRLIGLVVRERHGGYEMLPVLRPHLDGILPEEGLEE